MPNQQCQSIESKSTESKGIKGNITTPLKILQMYINIQVFKTS